MAILNGFLRSIAVDDNVRDYAHASRTFIDGNYRLAPKYKFIFYVLFGVNPAAVGAKSHIEEMEIGQLVKTIDLPKFDVDLQEYNQYNRTRNVQTKFHYDPVTITFHDDSSNVIRDFWYKYYSYYNHDPSYPETSYFQNDRYRRRTQQSWGMTGDKEVPYLNFIKIYSLSQKVASEYTLINPKIEKFDFDTHDNFATADVMQHTMQIRYESVKMATKHASDIPGFGELHYDTRPSPLNPAGGNTDSLLGPGGVLDTGQSIAGDLASGNVLGAVFKGISAGNNWKGTDFKAVATEELVTIGRDILRGKNPANAYYFPSGTSGSDANLAANRVPVVDTTVNNVGAYSEWNPDPTVAPYVSSNISRTFTNGIPNEINFGEITTSLDDFFT